ncbi:CRADD protein, partial [Galbula dea]|nr:CRADD protein [Galbula dea]NXI48224.1 CRADD protein [Galbula dea]
MSQGERETLLALQRALSEEQFESLKYLLEGRGVPLGELRPATRPDLCRLLLQRFPGQALQVMGDLLRHIARHDLIRLHRLPGAEEETPGNNTGGNSGSSSRGQDVGCQPVACPPRPRRLTEKDLIQIAQKLGREWQEVGICCLGLERTRLDQIREDEPHNVVMQRFKMLQEWRWREGEEATAPRLLSCLAPASVDPELRDLLRSFQGD